MNKRKTVVGAIISNKQGEIFCALRSPTMTLPNMWEFPGGKVERGEEPWEALEREIREEFGCSIRADRTVYCEHTHKYGDHFVRLLTIHCVLEVGQPLAVEHAQTRWMPIKDLNSLDWAPADLPTVYKLMGEAGFAPEY